MLKKSFSRTGKSCRVTFELPPGVEAKEASLCGDFNEWSPGVHTLKQRKDGRLSATVSLKSGRNYRFKYLLEGGRWENDKDADAYVPNDFGTEDSVIEV
jgi:1,4-alpha-glucan branching enzyme